MKAQGMYWMVPAILAALIVLVVILNNPVAVQYLQPIITANISKNQTNTTNYLKGNANLIYSIRNVYLGSQTELYYTKNIDPIEKQVLANGYMELSYTLLNPFERSKTVEFFVGKCDKIILDIDNYAGRCATSAIINSKYKYGFGQYKENREYIISLPGSRFIENSTNKIEFKINSLFPECDVSFDYNVICLNRKILEFDIPKNNYKKELHISGTGNCIIYIDNYEYEGICNLVKDVTGSSHIKIIPDFQTKNVTIKLIINYPKKLVDVFSADPDNKYKLVFDATLPVKVCINSYCIFAKNFNNLIPNNAIKEGSNIIVIESNYESYINFLKIEKI